MMVAFRFLASLLATAPLGNEPASVLKRFEETIDDVKAEEKTEAVSESSSAESACEKALSHLLLRSSFSSLSPAHIEYARKGLATPTAWQLHETYKSSAYPDL